MVTLKHIVSSLLAIGSFVSTFYAVGKLMFFLSKPNETSFETILLNNLLDNNSLITTIISILSSNTIWIILFILQHSLMKTEFVKSIWRKIGLDIAERSLYNLATSKMLLLLITNWKTSPSFTFWNFDVSKNTTLWWTFVLIHSICWIIIYGGSLLMDLSEILGIKQVYYDINKLSSPMSYKSPELRRLYDRVRHPSFLGISIILWLPNIMSLDRFVLAVFWTLYMFCAWNIEPKDYNYQKNQLTKKKYELSNSLMQ